MSDSGELIKKADALLGRYRGSDEPAIPVLTEIVEPPARAGALSDRTHAADPQLDELLERLRGELSAAIEAQLRARLGRHLDAALELLASRMKAEVEPLVRAAVDEAIARLGAEMRGRDAR